MIELPCKNCLTLAICKSVGKKEVLNPEKVIVDMINKCKIIEDYIFFNCAYKSFEDYNKRKGDLKYQSSQEFLKFFKFPLTICFTRKSTAKEYLKK